MAGNGKINHGKGVLSAAALAFPFQNIKIGKRMWGWTKDGSTIKKLDVLENMMGIKRNAMMIEDFTDRGPKLFTEKAAGNMRHFWSN